MRSYITRRLLLTIPTLVLVSLIVFISVRFIPGSIIDTMVAEISAQGVGSKDAQYGTVENIRKSLGLDMPVHVQYAVLRLEGEVQNNVGYYTYHP